MVGRGGGRGCVRHTCYVCCGLLIQWKLLYNNGASGATTSTMWTLTEGSELNVKQYFIWGSSYVVYTYTYIYSYVWQFLHRKIQRGLVLRSNWLRVSQD